MLEIFIINAFSDNYIYLLRNERKNITSVIDPGEAEPVIKWAEFKGYPLPDKPYGLLFNIGIICGFLCGLIPGLIHPRIWMQRKP